MATSYGATPPGITGTHYGGSGLGVLGSLVPSAGLDGAGYLYAGLSLPADAGKEVRGPITRWPAGTLTVYEDSSFSYTGATDHALYQLYVDGVASAANIGYGAGIGRFDLSIGNGLSGAIALGLFGVSGSFGTDAGGAYRPTSDISATGWTAVPSGSLYSTLDESSPEDADYITTVIAGASPAVMGIGPLPAGTYTLRVRAGTDSGSGVLRVRLQATDGTVLATSADQAITTAPTTFTLTMTITATATRVALEVA